MCVSSREILGVPALRPSGFSYECWHLRYVGKDVSYIMHNENILTLEEYHLLKYKNNKKVLVKQK